MKTAITALALLAVAAGGQDPAKLRLKEALKDTEVQGDWVYDDLGAGIARAKKAKKPMLIVFR